jgi:hypothetical protein
MKAIKINKFIFSIVFKRLFNKGNRKHFFRVPIEFIETLVKVWEKLELRGNTRTSCSCSHATSRFSQTFTRVSITLYKHGKCFLFLKYQYGKNVLYLFYNIAQRNIKKEIFRRFRVDIELYQHDS